MSFYSHITEQDKMIKDGLVSTANENLFIPPYCKEVCYKDNLDEIIDKAIKLHSEYQGKYKGIPTELSAFCQYLYDNHNVDPMDLEYLFALVMKGLYNSMETGICHSLNTIEQRIVEVYGDSEDND